jgi:hypothetical protein
MVEAFGSGWESEADVNASKADAEAGYASASTVSFRGEDEIVADGVASAAPNSLTFDVEGSEVGGWSIDDLSTSLPGMFKNKAQGRKVALISAAAVTVALVLCALAGVFSSSSDDTPQDPSHSPNEQDLSHTPSGPEPAPEPAPAALEPTPAAPAPPGTVTLPQLPIGLVVNEFLQAGGDPVMYTLDASQGTSYLFDIDLGAGLDGAMVELCRDQSCNHHGGVVLSQVIGLHSGAHAEEEDIEWTCLTAGQYVLKISDYSRNGGQFTVMVVTDDPCGIDRVNQAGARLQDDSGEIQFALDPTVSPHCAWTIQCPNQTDVVTVLFEQFRTAKSGTGHNPLTLFDGSPLMDTNAPRIAVLSNGFLSDGEWFCSTRGIFGLRFEGAGGAGVNTFGLRYSCASQCTGTAPPPPPLDRKPSVPPPPPICTRTPPVCNGHGVCNPSTVAPYYACACYPGWQGQTCAAVADPCSSSPCMHNAPCDAQGTGFSCSCLQGYEGTLCGNTTAPAPPIRLPVCQDVCQGFPGVVRYSGEEIWFTFAATAGHTYSLDTTVGSLADTVMSLWNPQRTMRLAENDDDYRDTGRNDSYIEWTCQSTGTYPVMVRGFQSATGSFALLISERDQSPNAAQGGDPCNGGERLSDSAAVIVFAPQDGAASRCSWTITCPTTTDVVNLRFRRFSTELHHDTVTLHDGACVAGLCGPAIAGAQHLSGAASRITRQQFESSAAAMTVVFRSDHNTASDGFDLSYFCAVAPPPPPPPAPCASNPCLRGSCTDFAHTYACRCDSGWEGTNCNTEESPCDNNPCRNGAGCVSQGATFTCTCVHGYEGTLCGVRHVTQFTDVQANGIAVTGTVAQPGDESWFHLQAEAGRTYSLDTSAGTLQDTIMALYAVDGTTQIVENDDDPRHTSSTDSYIEWTCPVTGIYSILVRGYLQATGTFTLTVTETGGGHGATGAGGDPCRDGAVMTESAAVISFEPAGGTDANQDCTWSITCPASTDVVTLLFRHFDTELNYDTVTLYNGAEFKVSGSAAGSASNLTVIAGAASLSGSLAQFHTRQFNSDGQSMTIQFRSDNSIGGDGFSASYLCGLPPPPPPVVLPPPPPPPCALNPCQHGVCINVASSYECTCYSGWAGQDCDTQIDPCSSNPCGAHGVCVTQGFALTCTCAAGYRGEHCDQTVVPPQAWPLFPDGVPTHGQVSSPGDEELFTLDAVQGHTYLFDTTVGTLEDTMMILYAPDGNWIAENDDDARNTGARDSFIEWTCTRNGTYTVMVRGFGSAVGDFSLAVREASASNEPCAGSGARLQNETSAVILFTPPGGIPAMADCRWLIQCPASSDVVVLHFVQFDTEGHFDTLSIYDGEDQLHTGNPMVVLSGRLQHGQISDTHQVAHSNLFVTTGRSMVLQFRSDSSVSSNSFEASYLCGTASPSPPPPSLPPPPPPMPMSSVHPIVVDGVANPQLILNPGDVVWFSFDAVQGQTYQLETAEVSVQDTVMSIWTPDRSSRLAQNDNDDRVSGRLTSYIEWTCPSSGTYLVSVHALAADVGAFTLRVGQGLDAGGDPCDGGVLLRGVSAAMISFAPDGHHAHDSLCSWHVICPAAHSVSLTFLSFGVEYGTEYVELHDGATNTAPMLPTAAPARLTGTLNLLPAAHFQTSGADLFMVFSSDDQLGSTASGFQASYACVADVTTTPPPTPPPPTSAAVPIVARARTDPDYQQSRLMLSVARPFEVMRVIMQAQAGSTYQLETSAGTLLDTRLVLLGPDEATVLAENDNDDRTTGRLDAYIEWTCPVTGTYFVHVAAFLAGTGSFTLTATLATAANDPCATGTGGATLQGMEGTLVSFQPGVVGTACHHQQQCHCRWTFLCAGASQVVALRFQRFNLSSDMLANNVLMYNGRTANPASVIAMPCHHALSPCHNNDMLYGDLAQLPSTHFRSTGPSLYMDYYTSMAAQAGHGFDVTYTCRNATAPPPPPPPATRVRAGGPYTRAGVHAPGDVQRFEFVAVRGRTYQIECKVRRAPTAAAGAGAGGVPLADTHMELLDVDGSTAIALNDNDVAVTGQHRSYIEWTCPRSGTYFVTVGAHAGATGTFLFRVTRASTGQPCTAGGAMLRMESAIISYHPNEGHGSGSHDGNTSCTWTIHCPQANEQVALSFQKLQTEEQVCGGGGG